MVAVSAIVKLAAAAPTFTVTFDDPGNGWNAATRAALTAHTQAAGAKWGRLIAGNGVVDVVIRLDNSVPLGYGASLTSSFVFARDGINYFEQAAATKARGGPDANGAAPDIQIGLNASYLANELWLDPQPTLRSAPVPSNRTDAMSVFLHELGHAFCFNGWSNGIDQTWPGDYRSTWDQWLEFDAEIGLFSFYGPRTVAFIGPMPVTTGNPNHYANPIGQPGSELIPGLMNGVVFERGTRYDIGPLERAILRDCGIASPCPADIAGPNQALAPDGSLSADDIIVFLSRYFAADALADVAGPNQSPSPDGAFSADDIIVFLGQYFAGC